MMTIYDVLRIKETDVYSEDELKRFYTILVKNNVSDDIQFLGSFLCDSAQRQSVHWSYCLDAIIEAVEKNNFLLPVKMLENLSTLLLNDAEVAVHKRGCDLLAYVACRDQHLPDSALFALENILENGSESLCDTAAAALSGAFANGQLLTRNILQLVESAFTRHTSKREHLGLFLHGLLEKEVNQPLLLITYEGILKDHGDLDSCFNILSASARNGHEIPSAVFESLSIALEHQPMKEKAFDVLMTCIADKRNRQNIAPQVLAKIRASLEQVLLEEHANINKYAACALGYLVCDEEPFAEEPLNHGAQTIQQMLLVKYLKDSLNDSLIRQYAVFPLHHLLSQGKESLLDDAFAALGKMITDPKSSFSLREKAIELMGLSARKSKNLFSPDAFKVLDSVLNERNPALSTCCLKAVLYHLSNPFGINVFPSKIMKHVMSALNHKETLLDAINILNRMLDGAEARDQSNLLGKFLVVANARIFQRVLKSHDEIPREVMKLFSLAQQYHPEDAQRVIDALDEQAADEELAPQSAQPTAGSELTLNQLLDSLEEKNKNNDTILQLLNEDTLSDQLYDIAATHEMDSALFPLRKPIKDWDENDCLCWAKKIKTQPEKARDPAFLAEIIAVIAQGVILTTRHTPRVTQFISLLLLLDAKDKGRLAQIATGEGKSTIVAMLAAIKALQGETVDVVSSSPLLAFRDAKEKADFFKLFDLTVASNWHPDTDNTKDRGFKPCYSADIVYGDANNFQFDLLRHDYKKENTRGEREYQTVIVDEVDSMLLDESSKIASLGSYKPLMAELEVLFSSVWIELCRRKERMKKDDFTFPIDERTGKPYTKTDYLKDTLEQLLIKMLEDPDASAQIPKHLQSYARSQAPDWARSAMMASENYVLGRDYEITKEKETGHKIIAPIDYINTGVIHPNSAWDDGLQQFLQLKHSLKFTAENLTASFISNRGYFKRYGKNIYGLTGTLGADDSQTLLKDVYDIDLAFVPTYKEKQFKEIPGALEETSEAWLAKVVALVKKEAEEGRAALVICESINKAHLVEAALRQANIHKIKSYTRSDNDENLVISEKVTSGDVIVATNLAGRGTDIKTSDEVEQKGGLYVCLTFLPKNRRIEDQGFGRTSRQGHKGTAQLVLNKQEVVQQLTELDPELKLCNTDSMENIKEWRDAIETKALEIVKEFELPKLIFKDALFTNFCEFTYGLRELDDNEAKLDEVEEQWGFWLKKTLRKIANEVTINEDEILNALEHFKANMKERFINEDLQNSSQWVQLGIHHGNYEEARVAYEKAITNDPKSIAAAQAHYRLAHFYVSKQNKDAAITELKAAKTMLTEYIIPRLEMAAQLPLFYQNPEAHHKAAANVQQTQRRIHLLKIQIAYIDRDISVLQHAERAIKTTGAKGLRDFFNDDNRPKDEISELYNIGLPHLFEIQEVPKKKKKGISAWIRRAVVVVVGVCQIVIGACLTITGNIALGNAFIEMGVSDILFAVRSAIEGTECTWQEYRAHKIVSTAITFATMGIGLLRESSNFAKHGVKSGAANTAAGHTVTQQTVQTQFKHAIQRGVIREGFHYGMSAIAKGMIADHKEEIRDKIRSTLMARFNQADFKQQINSILSIDGLNGNSNQAENLQRIAFAIIQPKRNAFASMSESIVKGVASNVSPLADAAIKVCDIACTIDKIIHLCDNFCDEFSDKLPLIVHQLPKLTAEQSQHTPDLCNTRSRLYDSMTNQITQFIMASLRNEVITSVLDFVVTDRVDQVVKNSFEKQRVETAKSTEDMLKRIEDQQRNPRKQEPSVLDIHRKKESAEILQLLQHQATIAAHVRERDAIKATARRAHLEDPQHSKPTVNANHARKQTVVTRVPPSTTSKQDPKSSLFSERVQTQPVAEAFLSVARETGQLMTRIPPVVAARALPIEQTHSEAGLNLGDRTMGAVQCAFGVLEVAVGAFGGVVTAPSGIGPVMGSMLATNGLDNAVAGSRTVWTGKPQSTWLNQSLKSTGLSSTTADVVEVCIGLSPAALPAAARFSNKALASAQRARTEYQLRNGFFGSATAHHVTGNAAIAQSVASGINPMYLNPNARFGGAFHLAENPGTALREVLYSPASGGMNASTPHSLRYHLNLEQAKILDLSQPSIARHWGYGSGAQYDISQKIAINAQKEGYNVIRYPCERGPGSCIAIFSDFDAILSPQMIVPVPSSSSELLFKR